MKRIYWLLAVPILGALLQAAVYQPRLPETVASHFDGAGNPNGWASRESFLAVLVGALSLTTLVFVAILALLPVIPKGLINLPRRDYWLAPERKAATLAFLGRQLVWFTFATQLFLLAIFQLTIEANLEPPHRLANRPFYVLLAAYLLFTAGWVVRFYLRFLKRPAASEGARAS